MSKNNRETQLGEEEKKNKKAQELNHQLEFTYILTEFHHQRRSQIKFIAMDAYLLILFVFLMSIRGELKTFLINITISFQQPPSCARVECSNLHFNNIFYYYSANKKLINKS